MTERGKLKDKAVVYAGLGPDGRQRQRTRVVYADTARELAKAVEAARVALRAEMAEEAKWKGTVRELAEEWMVFKRHDHAEATKYANRVMINRIIRDIGKIRLEKLTARDLDRFYQSLMDGGLSASTANHYHRIINGMLHQAFRWGSVPGNVAKLATPPRKRGDGTHHLPTPAALRALLVHAPQSLRVAALIAAGTGCRRGEIVGLCWSDIDGDQLTVSRSLVDVPGKPLTAKSPKSGKARHITLDADLLDVLAAHRVWLAERCTELGGTLAPNGPILGRVSGKRIDATGSQPYTPHWLTQAWTHLCEANGVKFRFHDLRHFHASQLIGSGLDVAVVSKRLGHAQVSTTLNIYTQALPAGDRVAAATMGDIMRG